MTQRTKLELGLNSPTELTLLFDDPIVGKSQYGDYFMYAVAVGDDEYSFFAPVEVHSELSKLKKGQKAIVTKLAAQRGGKLVTSYDVKLLTKEVKVPVTQTADANHEGEDLSPAPHDNFFAIMLRSYKDGLEISRELNGLADPEKIAVTLFIARSKQSNY